jgi:quinol monooxygenase YgiN
MPFVSVTRLRVRSWRYLPAFLIQSFRALRQAKRAEGNLAASVFRDADLAFWTRTVWTGEAAMRAFMRSGAHQQVMPLLAKRCNEAALVHWVQEGSEPPSWQEAHRRLQQQGRRSRVDQPSEAHRRFDIPAPKLSSVT